MLFRKDDPLMDEEISPHAPEKQGYVRMGELLLREFWELIKLNMVFLLCCLPIVTIGPALLAMNRVLRDMVQDRSLDWWAAYRQNFHTGWKRGSLLSVCVYGMLAGACVGTRFYFAMAARTPMFYLPFMFCATVAFLAISASAYVFGLPAEMPLGRTLKTALLLGLLYPIRTVAAIASVYVLQVMAVLTLPFSTAYLLFIGFSLTGFLAQFFTRIPLRTL